MDEYSAHTAEPDFSLVWADIEKFLDTDHLGVRANRRTGRDIRREHFLGLDSQVQQRAVLTVEALTDDDREPWGAPVQVYFISFYERATLRARGLRPVVFTTSWPSTLDSSSIRSRSLRP